MLHTWFTNVCAWIVCSDHELTLFAGNEAGPSIIRQTHLSHWKRKGMYGERKQQLKIVPGLLLVSGPSIFILCVLWVSLGTMPSLARNGTPATQH